MMYKFQFLSLLPFLLITACSGSSSSDPVVVDPNTTAIETCYDVRIINAGNSITKNICTTKENGGYNGLGVRRFIRFSVNAFSTVSIRVTRTKGLSPADPDIVLFSNGIIINLAESTTANFESMSTNLSAGDYVVELTEFGYAEDDAKPQFNKSLQQKTTGGVQTQSSDASSCVSSTATTLFVSGFVKFERVPHNGNALDYSSPIFEAIQEAVVQVICNGGVYDSGVTGADGSYRLTFPGGSPSFVRVKAQMLNGTAWDFSVVDNNSSGQPVYVLDDSAFTSSSDYPDNDFNAGSGWGGNSYTGPRAAAPFAILDSVRKAKDKVLSAASVNFPALKINWSPLNSLTNPGSSFYDSGSKEITLLGAENSDTDEYDEHVIIHEWGHYFEDNFSRSDSIGGSHSGSDILDIRVAFGEGFGNAFSAIVMGDAVYIDTKGNQQGAGFSINMESNNCVNAGWFSECSVQSTLYDLFDSNNDGADSLNLNFSALYDVLVNEQKNTQAMTSIFSFIKSFKDRNGASANAIDALLSAQKIDPITDIYGASQITANPGVSNQLPVYEAF